MKCQQNRELEVLYGTCAKQLTNAKLNIWLSKQGSVELLSSISGCVNHGLWAGHLAKRLLLDLSVKGRFEYDHVFVVPNNEDSPWVASDPYSVEPIITQGLLHDRILG